MKIKLLQDDFKFPLRIEYRRVFPEWHEKARPTIVDADGKVVCSMNQNVVHPGMYDKAADEMARMFERLVNWEAGYRIREDIRSHERCRNTLDSGKDD